MFESSFHNLVAVDCLPNPLVVQLRRFTTSLIEQGYLDQTVRSKLQVLTNLGLWLKQSRLAITNPDEPLVEAFLKRQRRERRGDLRTLQQFLDQLRRQNVVPARNLPGDRSPLARILNQYETHLRTERGLVAHTILEYATLMSSPANQVQVFVAFIIGAGVTPCRASPSGCRRFWSGLCKGVHCLRQLRIHLVRDDHDIRQQQVEIQSGQMPVQCSKDGHLKDSRFMDQHAGRM